MPEWKALDESGVLSEKEKKSQHRKMGILVRHWQRRLRFESHLPNNNKHGEHKTISSYQGNPIPSRCATMSPIPYYLGLLRTMRYCAFYARAW
jgi:hypothetical protein